MKDEFWIAKHEKAYRDSADKILLDIQKKNWNIDYQTLKSFCRYTYDEIVNIYSGLEKTQKYFFTGQILSVRGCISDKGLAFCVGEGFTRSEIAATHTIGWELQRLLDEQKINSEPFDLKLLIVGYRRGGGGNWPQSLPLIMRNDIVLDDLPLVGI